MFPVYRTALETGCLAGDGAGAISPALRLKGSASIEIRKRHRVGRDLRFNVTSRKCSVYSVVVPMCLLKMNIPCCCLS